MLLSPRVDGCALLIAAQLRRSHRHGSETIATVMLSKTFGDATASSDVICYSVYPYENQALAM